MKKIIYILLLSSCLFSASTEIKFLNNFEAAKQEATTYNKNILVMFTQEGCPACEYMESVAFEDEALSNYLTARFILVKLDINNDRIPPHLKAYGTPTFYILDQNGRKIGRQIVGGGKADAFLKLLQTYKTNQ